MKKMVEVMCCDMCGQKLDSICANPIDVGVKYRHFRATIAINLANNSELAELCRSCRNEVLEDAKDED